MAAPDQQRADTRSWTDRRSREACYGEFCVFGRRGWRMHVASSPSRCGRSCGHRRAAAGRPVTPWISDQVIGDETFDHSPTGRAALPEVMW